MDQNPQKIFEFLENLRQITLTMKAEVEAGQWEQFSFHVRERQEVIEGVGDLLVMLKETEKAKVKHLVCQDLLRLKKEQEKILALRRFR